MRDGQTYKVHANGVEEVLVEAVLSVPEQQTGLTNSRVADQQHLEEEVAAKSLSLKGVLLFLRLSLH